MPHYVVLPSPVGFLGNHNLGSGVWSVCAAVTGELRIRFPDIPFLREGSATGEVFRGKQQNYSSVEQTTFAGGARA